MGFVAPALQIEGRGFDFVVKPLNDRGVVLAACIKAHLMKSTELFNIKTSIAGDTNGAIRGSVIPSTRYFAEEERSKQPSLFSLIRAIQELFSSPDAGQLGLYGALGYDLTFQFEPIKLSAERDAEARDLVMFLPDEIMVVDNQKKAAWNIKYEFTGGTGTADKHLTTIGVPRVEAKSPFVMAEANTKFEPRDGVRGKYAESVVLAKEEFRVGNLFEVVLSQAFREQLKVKPSTIFRRLAHTRIHALLSLFPVFSYLFISIPFLSFHTYRQPYRLCQRNPSPYGFFMNLGRYDVTITISSFLSVDLHVHVFFPASFLCGICSMMWDYAAMNIL